jgi:hypothetical protein
VADYVRLNGVRIWYDDIGETASSSSCPSGAVMVTPPTPMDSELVVVRGTSHPLLMEKPELCLRLVTDVLTTDPVPILVPLRRAS